MRDYTCPVGVPILGFTYIGGKKTTNKGQCYENGK